MADSQFIELYHFTEKLLVFDKERRYENQSYKKPHGLWLSDISNSGWKTWRENNDFFINKLTFKKKFIVDTSNVLLLNSEKSVLDFTDVYIKKDCKIAWDRVSKKFGGICINPYFLDYEVIKLDAKMSWYLFWDCSSACIWDLSLLTQG